MTTRREGTQPHLPKLSYRSTRTISDHSIRSVATQSSAASNSTCATSPPASSFGGSPRSFRLSEDVPSPFSLDGASDPHPSSPSLSPQAAKAPKKKASSVFKFFSVKEPSTQAFEAYQEQMKKRGTTQSGRANAVGLPGVSSARLPPTVPKVNSKWDGVPQAAKDKPKDRSNTSRQSFASSASRPLYTSQSSGSNMTTRTMSSTGSTRSDLRGNGKLRLHNGSGNLADLYGWETPLIGTSSNGSSTKSLPLQSRGSPSSAPTLQREHTSFFPQSPSILTTAYESSAESPPPLELPSNRPSPVNTPSLPSTPTPDYSVHALPWYPSDSGPYNPPPKEPLVPKKDAVILNSFGTNVLGPPISATRKPGPILSAGEDAIKITLPPDAPTRPPLQQPNSILKRHAEIPSPVDALPLPPKSSENIARPSAATNRPKPRRMHMMSVFNKDTKP
ncbi:MAG: hypothetical protein L6R40_006043 [Gallowayella cf. fulva]|nr:MAG: hypothetical protein L6R40_006043 [Xanthomendoza cf. fulva]